MASIFDKLTDSEAMKFIDQVNEPFKNLPHLPEGVVKFFVSIAPWMALIFGALSGLAGIIGALGSLATLFTLNPMYIMSIVVGTILLFVHAALLLTAYTPLKNREMKGWTLIFWSQIISVVQSLISMISSGPSGIVMTIISTAIGLYFLFEMRSSYGPLHAVAEKVEKIAKGKTE